MGVLMTRLSLLQNTRTSGNAVHGRIQDEVDRPEGGDGAAPAAAASSDASQEGNINVARLMGSIEYGRPLAQGAFGLGLTIRIQAEGQDMKSW